MNGVVVTVDTDALNSTAAGIAAVGAELSGLRSALRTGDVDLAEPVADALRSFGKNSGELLGEITTHSNGAADDLRKTAACYRALEDSLVASWTAGRAR